MTTRARRPRPLWIVAACAVMLGGAIAGYWLTATIDGRERTRFRYETERFFTALSDRMDGLETIAVVLPILVSRETGIDVASLAGSYLGTGSADGLLETFAAFPLEGLIGFAFVAQTPFGDQVLAFPNRSGVHPSIFSTDEATATWRRAYDVGGPAMSDPIVVEPGAPVRYVLAIGLPEGAEGGRFPVDRPAAMAVIDAVPFFIGGPTLDVLAVRLADGPTGMGLLSTDVAAPLATHRTVRIFDRPYEVTLAPGAAFDLQDGAPAGWSLFAMSVAIAGLVWVVGVLDRRRDELHEARLREAQATIADKDRFIAALSHALRTPLTAIVGITAELAEGGIDPTEGDDLIRIVAAQSQEMSMLVEDLLVAGRVESDTIAWRPEPVDLVREAERVTHGLGVGDHLAIEGPGATAWADPLRVRQIVRNLVANAIRHGGPDVRVRVGTAPDGAFVEVSDDGPGIDPDVVTRVFDPYAHAARPDGLAPTAGLGLAVARDLTRLMGGDLVYVAGPRTTFRVVLPSRPRVA